MSTVSVEVAPGKALEIAYDRVGEGPPLVFVHGAAEDGRVWQPQLGALADEYTVVAWDEPGARVTRRGVGRSMPNDHPLSAELRSALRCLA